METLLISPASRSEIVLGKFLTVMLASVTTADAQSGEHGADGRTARPPGRDLVGRGGPPVGGAASSVIAPPTLQAAFWMMLLLIPLAALFSAVCVSLAVLARSMKEGQYYMTPLYLVCMPLVFVTLMPGVELDLFYSLVPVTGVALLAASLDPGQLRRGLAVFLAGAGADAGLRGGRPALGRRPVSARGRIVPRVRAVQSGGLAAAHSARPRPAADRRPGGIMLCADAELDVVLDAIPGAARG